MKGAGEAKLTVGKLITYDTHWNVFGAAGGIFFAEILRGAVKRSGGSISMSEVVETIAVPEADLLDVAAAAGDIQITLVDATGFTEGMVISIAGSPIEYRGIVDITANVVTLDRALEYTHADEAVVTEVGNTGTYTGTYTPAAGDFSTPALAVGDQLLVSVSAPTLGIFNKIARLDIVGNTVDDVNAHLTAQDAVLADILDSLAPLETGEVIV